MTILELLQADHRSICDLLARLSDTTSGQVVLRRMLFAKLRHELLRHAQTEQDVFYPALLERGADKEVIFDGIEDHAAFAFMLGEVEALSVNDGKWFEALIDLSQAVQRHFQTEEDVIFERAREHLGDFELVESILEH
jgi:iron-sulfur cluster repair protein YtfE (RIC family)